MITVEHLLARRAHLAEVTKRRPARAYVPPKPRQPRAEQLAYTKLLLAATRELTDAVRDELRSAGLVVDADGALGAIPPGKGAAIVARINAIADRVAAANRWLAPLDNIADQVSRFSQREFEAQVRGAISKLGFERIAAKAMGIDLFRGDPALARARDEFRRQNLDLIVSHVKSYTTQVTDILAQAGGNTRVEDIRDRIMEAAGASESHAALIARDQVLKLNANITQTRHEAAGITQYVWRTSEDERVRPAHRLLDGTRQSYAQPPVVDPKRGRREHPGGDYQCRCTADPIIPGLDADAPTEPDKVTEESIATVPPPWIHPLLRK